MAKSIKKSSSAKPFVSIILPVQNAGRTLDRGLSHLFGGKFSDGTRLVGLKYPSNKMEVLVVDGGGVDGTSAILQKWQKKHRSIKQIPVVDGQSLANSLNQALKSAKGKLLFFMQGDCAPEPDWVERMVEPFQMDPQVGLVGGELYTLPFEPSNAVEQYCQQSSFRTVGDRVGKKNGGFYPAVLHGWPHEVDGSSTCPFFDRSNLAVSRPAIKAIGFQFQDSGAAGAIDLSLRVSKAGFKLYFQPTAVVRCIQPAVLSQFYRVVADQESVSPQTVKAHAKRVLDLRFQYFGGISIIVPFPVPALIYWGDFHFMHLFGIWALAKTFQMFSTAGATWVTALSSNPVLALWFLYFIFKFLYFAPALRIQPASNFLLWCWIRYRSNLARVLGALKGSLKVGRLVVGSSR